MISQDSRVGSTGTAPEISGDIMKLAERLWGIDMTVVWPRLPPRRLVASLSLSKTFSHNLLDSLAFLPIHPGSSPGGPTAKAAAFKNLGKAGAAGFPKLSLERQRSKRSGRGEAPGPHHPLRSRQRPDRRVQSEVRGPRHPLPEQLVPA